jgi:hypothetical protein
MTALPETHAALAEVAKAVRGRFFIPSEEVQQMQQAAGCSMDTLLLAMLDDAAHAARPMISHFRVGYVAMIAFTV